MNLNPTTNTLSITSTLTIPISSPVPGKMLVRVPLDMPMYSQLGLGLDTFDPFNEDGYDRLFESLAEHGQFMPVRLQCALRDGPSGKCQPIWLILDGHYRIRSLQFLKRESVEAVVDTHHPDLVRSVTMPVTDKELLNISLLALPSNESLWDHYDRSFLRDIAENGQRQPILLSPVDSDTPLSPVDSDTPPSPVDGDTPPLFDVIDGCQRIVALRHLRQSMVMALVLKNWSILRLNMARAFAHERYGLSYFGWWNEHLKEEKAKTKRRRGRPRKAEQNHPVNMAAQLSPSPPNGNHEEAAVGS